MARETKDRYLIYEHIIGLPDYLDSVNEELQMIAEEYHMPYEKACEFCSTLNATQPVDKYNRPRRLYVFTLT